MRCLVVAVFIMSLLISFVRCGEPFGAPANRSESTPHYVAVLQCCGSGESLMEVELDAEQWMDKDEVDNCVTPHHAT